MTDDGGYSGFVTRERSFLYLQGVPVSSDLANNNGYRLFKVQGYEREYDVTQVNLVVRVGLKGKTLMSPSSPHWRNNSAR